MSGKHRAEVSIVTEMQRAALFVDEEDSTAPVRRVVRRIVIVVDDQNIFVPGSVVCGLVLPTAARLRGTAKGFVLSIETGDAAGAAIAHIDFDSKRVTLSPAPEFGWTSLWRT